MRTWLILNTVWNIIVLGMCMWLSDGLYGLGFGPVLVALLTVGGLAVALAGIRWPVKVYTFFFAGLTVGLVRPFVGLAAAFSFGSGDDGGTLGWLAFTVLLAVCDWLLVLLGVIITLISFGRGDLAIPRK